MRLNSRFARPRGLSRHLHRYRTEGEGSARRSIAVGLGVFIGCLPIYGLHLAVCIVAARLLGLNRALTYLAANISNPLFAPPLMLAEVQIGRYLRTQSFYAVSVEQLQRLDPGLFAADLVIGSLAVGLLAGVALGGLTYLAIRKWKPDSFGLAAAAAADRYVDAGLWAWEFAHQKLRHDPIYRYALTSARLPQSGTLVDIGCGQGLMLSLLVSAAALRRNGTWPPAVPVPPLFDRLIGVEPRQAVAGIARLALAADAEIVDTDARTFEWPKCSAVLFFDVLHLIPYADQEALLTLAARQLEPDGVIMVREADPGAGWMFWLVRAGNYMRALIGGRLAPTFYFRSRCEWIELFTKLNLVIRDRDTRAGANRSFSLAGPGGVGATEDHRVKGQAPILGL